MATVYVLANNVNTTLASGISSGATTITLTSSANLPTLSAGQVMPLTLNDAATQDVFEIVYVTAIAGANLTVLRAQEGTTAQAWLAGDYAFSALTAGIANQYIQPGNESGSGFVVLNPSSAQSGAVKVTGVAQSGSVSTGAVTATTGAFSGAVSASSDGVTASTVLPAYTTAGAAYAAQAHMVIGQASLDISAGANAFTTAPITLSGAALFGTTYTVYAFCSARIASDSPSGASALTANPFVNSGATFSIEVTTADGYNSSLHTSATVNFFIIGY